MNINRINKIYEILVLLILWELLLGGLGNLLGFPIRKVIFIIGIIATLGIIYINKIRIKKRFFISIVLVGIYALYGSIIGLLNGNNIRDIFADANVFLGIIYILILSVYLQENINRIDDFLDIVVNASVIIAIITNVLFFFSRYYLPNDLTIIDKYMKLNSILNYGLITGLVYLNNYARVYLFNGIFMQIAATILIIRILVSTDKKRYIDNIKLIILMLGIFTSSTRGFWLGIVLAMLLILCYYVCGRFDGRNFKMKRLIVLGIITLIIIGLVPKTISSNSIKNIINNTMVEEDQIDNIINDKSGTEGIKDRLASVVDFKNNISNKVRGIQLKFLVDRIIQKPVLGWGFGAHIPEYLQYMKENNLQNVDTSSFELYYFELLFKTGALGIISILTFLLYKLFQLIKLFKKNKMTEKEKDILVAWTIGFISFMVSSFTNPYLASLSGFFILVVEIYILESLLEKYEIYLIV